MQPMSGAAFGHTVSPETRLKISKALAGRPGHPSPMKGRKADPEHVKKRADALRRWGPVCIIEGCGKPHATRGWCSAHYSRWKRHGDPLHVFASRTGPNATNWQGTAITYSAAHLRVRKATECQACGSIRERLEAALRHNVPPDRLLQSTQGPYSPEPSDYTTLCITCHRRYDSPKAATRATIETLLTRRFL